MQALAQAAQAFISEQRAAEAPDDETASTCAAVVGDGILRLAGSLEAAAPEPDSPQAADFDAAVAAIVAENQASLDALFATFPPPNVA